MPGAGPSDRNSQIHRPPRPLVLTGLVVITAVVAYVFHGGGDDAEGEAPFDFWVLALSWTPTYCADRENTDSEQCDGVRGFSVHGLWPQFEGGDFPEFCDAEGFPEPGRADLAAARDIFPDPGLARHEWNRHGSCSGLSATEYFAVTRLAAEAVAIPARLMPPTSTQRVSPETLERAFADANPGLGPDGMSVDCSDGKLEEVRICLTFAMEYRACPEVDRRSCRAASLAIPAGR
jgi:ribonuclease T2